MRCITTFIDKKTKEELSYQELEERYRNNFKTWTEFFDWRDENFDEKNRYVETPYERARNNVYATGNRWAIENWNSTHN